MLDIGGGEGGGITLYIIVIQDVLDMGKRGRVYEGILWRGGIGGDGYLVIRNSMGGKYAKFYNRNNSLTPVLLIVCKGTNNSPQTLIF